MNNKDFNTMTNAETISKLNNALNTLIKAYEELQEENSGLKNRVNELEDEVLDLEGIKEELELKISEFSENTEEDNSNISSMLGKIESLLNSSTNSSTVKEQEEPTSEDNEIEDEKKDQEESLVQNSVNDEKEEVIEADALNHDIFASIEPSNTKDEDHDNNNGLDADKKEEDNKIDLNRMASLLNGFNR